MEKRWDFFILSEAKVYRGGTFLIRGRVWKMEERKTNKKRRKDQERGKGLEGKESHSFARKEN